MNLKPPHVRHKKLKKLKPSLWTAIDKRSEKQGTLENPGAGGYEYFLVDTTDRKEIEAKSTERLQKRFGAKQQSGKVMHQCPRINLLW